MGEKKKKFWPGGFKIFYFSTNVKKNTFFLEFLFLFPYCTNFVKLLFRERQKKSTVFLIITLLASQVQHFIISINIICSYILLIKFILEQNVFIKFSFDKSHDEVKFETLFYLLIINL